MCMRTHMRIDMRLDISQIPCMQSIMPRRKQFPDKAVASFQPGTFERIEAVLNRDREDRTDFFRDAVERELKRRERQK